MTWEQLRGLVLKLPGAEDGTSYGTPALKVRGKLLARLKEDGASVVLFMGMDEKEMLLEADPVVFHTTPHYDGYPAVLARLAPAEPDQLFTIVERSWRTRAGKRLLAQRGGG